MPAARARQEHVWLTARLLDLLMDARRYRNHAEAHTWPDVANALMDVEAAIEAARRDLSLIGNESVQ